MAGVVRRIYGKFRCGGLRVEVCREQVKGFVDSQEKTLQGGAVVVG